MLCCVCRLERRDQERILLQWMVDFCVLCGVSCRATALNLIWFRQAGRRVVCALSLPSVVGAVTPFVAPEFTCHITTKLHGVHKRFTEAKYELQVIRSFLCMSFLTIRGVTASYTSTYSLTVSADNYFALTFVEPQTPPLIYRVLPSMPVKVFI